MIYTDMTRRAMKICFEAHKDQLDKSGIPYVFHPIHVAEQMKDEITTAAALLHDVAEDSAMTLDDLRKAGFPDVVLDALKLLTHENHMPYLEYVRKLAADPVAKAVKLADLSHNSDISRMETVTEKDLKRLEKYKKAMELLTETPAEAGPSAEAAPSAEAKTSGETEPAGAGVRSEESGGHFGDPGGHSGDPGGHSEEGGSRSGAPGGISCRFSSLYDELKGNLFDADSRELWTELLDKAVKYTVWRAGWSLMSVAEKAEADSARTSCHDALIVKFNRLSRYLDAAGIAHSWRKALGEDRRDIGDFANYIVFREAVNNR